MFTLHCNSINEPVNNAMDMLLRINVSDERQRYPHVGNETWFLVSGKGNILTRSLTIKRLFWISKTKQKRKRLGLSQKMQAKYICQKYGVDGLGKGVAYICPKTKQIMRQEHSVRSTLAADLGNIMIAFSLFWPIWTLCSTCIDVQWL